MPNRITKHITLLLCLSMLSLPLHAKSFTSAKVISSAHSRSCLDYKILPNPCIYMYFSCSLFGGCGIKFTARDRIKHKLPDLVVSTFREPGDNPWTEIRLTESRIAKATMDNVLVHAFKSIDKGESVGFEGAGRENGHVGLGSIQSVKNLRFNETNVIGSPAPKVIRRTMKYTVPSIFGRPFLCKSTVRPLFPYMMSEVDAIAWRKAEVNMANTAADIARTGGRHIGSLSLNNPNGNTWGTVYPRIGFVYQTEPAKAAAVVAQRAIDIVSQPSQYPHIYSPYGYRGVKMFKAPPETYLCGDDGDGEHGPTYSNCTIGTSFAQWMRPANEHSKSWQMITPKKNSRCEAFGTTDVNWSRGKNTEDGDYAWNYWRQYECCKPGPGILLNP